MPCPRFPKKTCHKSKAAALKALTSLQRQGPVSDYLRPYKCPVGEHWHLGHDTKLMQQHIRNALRVGTVISRKSARVRKRK